MNVFYLLLKFRTIQMENWEQCWILIKVAFVMLRNIGNFDCFFWVNKHTHFKYTFRLHLLAKTIYCIRAIDDQCVLYNTRSWLLSMTLTLFHSVETLSIFSKSIWTLNIHWNWASAWNIAFVTIFHIPSLSLSLSLKGCCRLFSPMGKTNIHIRLLL